MTTVKLNDVRMAYGKHVALHIDDLVVAGPGLVCLRGANGAGKTTLLQTIAGLQAPSRGTVHIDEFLVSRHRRPDVVYGPDRPVLFDDLELDDNRRHVVALAGRGEVDPLGQELWEAFGLIAMAQRFPSQLSRGQRQKASLAIALSRSAPLVLLDEPTIALDADARNRLVTALVSGGESRLIIVSSHSNEMLAAATEIIELDDGRLADQVT